MWRVLALEVQGLSYQYQKKRLVLKELNLLLPRGKTLGLLGVNGAGKSTLIGLLTGRLALQEGKLNILGETYEYQRNSILKQIALVPQGYAFYPKLTVLENLNFFAKLRSDLSALNERVIDALEFCQLTEYKHQYADTLSGGLKRRLNLAIGVVNRPQILFLDEPTVGIDPLSRDFILNAIQALKAQGMTIIYTSHHMEEVERLCDYLAVLDQGEILYQGDMAGLQQQQGLIIKAHVKSETELDASWSKFVEAYCLTYSNGWLTGKVNLTIEDFYQQLHFKLTESKARLLSIRIEPMDMEMMFFTMLNTARLEESNA